MGAHVLLNWLNVLRKRKIKCEVCQAFNLFFAASLISSIIPEYEYIKYYVFSNWRQSYVRTRVLYKRVWLLLMTSSTRCL